MGEWRRCTWLRMGPVSSNIEHGNKLTGYMNCGEFLDQLSDS